MGFSSLKSIPIIQFEFNFAFGCYCSQVGKDFLMTLTILQNYVLCSIWYRKDVPYSVTYKALIYTDGSVGKATQDEEVKRISYVIKPAASLEAIVFPLKRLPQKPSLGVKHLQFPSLRCIVHVAGFFVLP